MECEWSMSSQDCSKTEKPKAGVDEEPETPDAEKQLKVTPTEICFTRKYSDSLIQRVLQFNETNSLTETARHFNIPHSTIYTWQKKIGSSQPREESGLDMEQNQLGTIKDEMVEPVPPESPGNMGNLTLPLPLDVKLSCGGEEEPSWEVKEEVVECAKKHKSYQQAAKKYGFPADTIKEWAKVRKEAARAEKVEDEKPEVEKTKRVREYSDQVKEAAVKYGKEHGWTAAAVKFQTSSTSVSRWATYFDPKSPWKLKVILAAQVVGTKEASKKFKVAQSTLQEWIRVSGKFCPDIEDFDIESMDISGNYLSPKEPEVVQESCEVCGELLGRGETFLEHLAAQHLTEDGLCGVCGAEHEDFENHFKLHFGDGESMDSLPDVEDEDAMEVHDGDVQDILKDLLVEG